MMIEVTIKTKFLWRESFKMNHLIWSEVSNLKFLNWTKIFFFQLWTSNIPWYIYSQCFFWCAIWNDQESQVEFDMGVFVTSKGQLKISTNISLSALSIKYEKKVYLDNPWCMFVAKMSDTKFICYIIYVASMYIIVCLCMATTGLVNYF